MITMTRLSSIQIILLVCIAREVKCQPYPMGGPQSQSTLPQQSYPQNSQQSFVPNTQQTFPPNPNSQQSFSLNSQQSFPSGQFQYPSQFQQSPSPFQNPQFQQSTGTAQGTQPTNSMQPSPIQPNSMQSFQQPLQYPNQQQPIFQTSQNPSFPEYPPTGQMPYPIQGQSAEFLSRPNANQLQTNQGPLLNTNTQFSSPVQPGTQFTPQGQQMSQSPNQSGSPFSTPAQPGAQSPNQAQSSTQFSNQGQSSAPFPNQAQSGTQFAIPGQPSTQFANQMPPGTQFPNQGQLETQFSNPQASLNNMTPQGIPNTAGTIQNPGTHQGLSPGMQPQQTSNTAGSQLQTQIPTNTQGQTLPGAQMSPIISTQTGTQSGQPILQDNNSGMQFNNPEAQVAAVYIMKQLVSILSDPTARDTFVFMMSDLRNMLTNPQAYRVIQSGQFQDNRLNNPNEYNNNIPTLPQSNNIGIVTGPAMANPASYNYYHKQEQPSGSNTQDLASIITSTTSSLADLIKYKGRILTNLLRDEVQVKSNAMNRLVGDIPVVNTLTRMGTGLADQFIGTVDKTLSPFLNSGSGGTTAITNPQMNPQIPGLNTLTRMGSNIMDQTFGFINPSSSNSQVPANSTPPQSSNNNNNNLASGSNFQTTVPPAGSNYPGYNNEFNRQNK